MTGGIAMYLLYNVHSKIYEKSFDQLDDLMAYLAHFNIYIDRDHEFNYELDRYIDSRKFGMLNRYVSLRIQNKIGQSSEWMSGSAAGLGLNAIKKLKKHSGFLIDLSDKHNGRILVKDLQIIDSITYKQYILDSDDIEAILKRTCNTTRYKSCYDMPNFSYRSTSVPSIHKVKYYGCRYPKIKAYVREFGNHELRDYTRSKKRKQINYSVYWGDRYRDDTIGWKSSTKLHKQWEKKAMYETKNHVWTGRENKRQRINQLEYVDVWNEHHIAKYIRWEDKLRTNNIKGRVDYEYRDTGKNNREQ